MTAAARAALEILRIEQLFPSPTNPRKTFDQVALEELAASIREKGLIQPIVVRPHHNGSGAEVELALFEVVAGERRYRACKMAEVDSAPCIVRELDDVEVLEIQTIENLQRDDLHPLEEAQGFADLMKKASYDVDRIAERIGRSTKYVYDRVKLLQLTPEAQKVFLEGEITAGHAILLARLSTVEQNAVMGSDYDGLWRPQHSSSSLDLNLEEAPPHRPRKAVSVRELAMHIEHNVRFRPEDEDLPNLFPDTEVQLQVAEEQELKVVKITREFRVPDKAKEPGERTYGRDHWLRVDGQPDGSGWHKQPGLERCEHARMGVVVAGPGRGDAFLVCVEKKKCDHWKAYRQQKEKRAKKASSGQDSYAKQQERWRKEREQREAERERYKKATPALRTALEEELAELEGAALVNLVAKELDVDKSERFAAAIRTGPADLGRYVVSRMRERGFRHVAGHAVRMGTEEVVPTETEEQFFELAGVPFVPPARRDELAERLWREYAAAGARA